jgi:hypothetical protein
MMFHIVSDMPDDEVVLVLDGSPGFMDRYLALVEAADGDPGAAATFVELADYVAGLAAAMEEFHDPLVGCLGAVEKVAETSAEAEELIVWSLFDNLSPDDLRRLDPWLGPCTRSLLDAADQLPWS